MTTTMDRRSLLSRAALGATGLVAATAMGSLAPETAFASSRQFADAGQPDPNFAEGLIMGRNQDLLQVQGSDGRLHRIQLTGVTSVWKLRPTTIDQAKIGDGLYARGVLLPDGVLAAEAVWVNIVNLTVGITSISRSGVQFDHHGQKVVGHVQSGTTAAVYNGTPAVSDLSMLKVGRHAQVIGAWRPGTNEIDIATIYTSN
ncbi:cell wall protein [Kribbella jiaozuonensis]|uniref:Cell wall protein n=1 Tax=Kribbella jiaozuonensis TaxID=2575441 RepID=A0A4U3M2Z5_9ACTN|nr:cell wall protein [Kribbella jiaozuonensis]TKK83041.1 cell wall protein [Kribbella jiaozuonensis]